MPVHSRFTDLAAKAMVDALTAEMDKSHRQVTEGWDEVLPRTWWQWLTRRPASIKHHPPISAYLKDWDEQ